MLISSNVFCLVRSLVSLRSPFSINFQTNVIDVVLVTLSRSFSREQQRTMKQTTKRCKRKEKRKKEAERERELLLT